VINLKRRGKPIGDGDSLTVVANSYRLGGGGGYPWLATAPRVWRTDRRVQELLLEYAQKHAVSGAEFARSWRVMPSFWARPSARSSSGSSRAGSSPRRWHTTWTPPARRRATSRSGSHAPSIGASGREHLRRRARLAGALCRGLVNHRVIGDQVTTEGLRPFEALSLGEALDWCERTARRAGTTSRRHRTTVPALADAPDE
jgi:hypothetical protein